MEGHAGFAWSGGSAARRATRICTGSVVSGFVNIVLAVRCNMKMPVAAPAFHASGTGDELNSQVP
jgi:hypothetical protein